VGDKGDTLDMTMMLAFHDALRRDLTHLARLTVRADDDPLRVRRNAAGWELFKRFLRVHHTAEDDLVWPIMQGRLAGRTDELELLDAMEAEHAAIDPLLEAVDAALADRDNGPQRIGDLVDELTRVLTGHLTHEETDALPLIDHTLTQQEWQEFGEQSRGRIGGDAPRYLPWLLDGRSPERAAPVIALLPPPLLAAYRDEWKPAYDALDPWRTAGSAAG